MYVQIKKQKSQKHHKEEDKVLNNLIQPSFLKQEYDYNKYNKIY